MKHRPTLRRALLACISAALLTGTALAEREYLAWLQRYSSALSSTQVGVAIATDQRGNVVVAGYNDVSDDTWYTAKYDALTGALVWQKTFSNFVSDDRPNAITTDSAGNVIVTGFSTSANNRDYYTIKYAASDGTILWQARYNNAQNGADEAVAVVVDGSDNVTVTGKSVGTGTQEDFHTIKYNGATGGEIWNRRYNSAGNFPDIPRALALAPNGDVVVAGLSRVGSNQCYYTAKYATATGLVVWDETFDGATNDNDVATDVACDSSGNVVVTGYVRQSNGEYLYHTRKYASANGALNWSQTYDAPGGNGLLPAFIGVDANGDVIVSGTAVLDGFKEAFYVAKYAGTNGVVQWEKTSVPEDSGPMDFVDDDVTDMVVDAAGSAIITGRRSDPNTTGDDYYTVKFGNDGGLLWEEQFNGETDSGSDIAAAVAVDRAGNVAITGKAKKPSPSPFFEIITVRYNRFLLSDGDRVRGPGLTDAAVITRLNAPATANDGNVVTRITVKDGKKIFAAILPTANGSNLVGALQGQPAPGVMDGVFKSFNDPVCSPNGTYSFSGKISGVKSSEATGVWTTTINGTLQLALQTGKQVTGLPVGTLLKSVLSISQVNGGLFALITVSGTGVTGANSTLLYRLTAGGGQKVFRNGDPITANGIDTTIKKLSVYTPAKTSPGHGRYTGLNGNVANATLADKRTTILRADSNLTVNAVATSGDDATIIAAGAKWKSFGPFGADANGGSRTTLATLQPKLGGITSADDTAIMLSTVGTSLNTIIAREGNPAPGVPNGTYLSLSDPISNTTPRFAYLAKVKGSGIGGSNNTALFFGTLGAPSAIVRTNDIVADAAGSALEQTFTGFKSIALPSGTDASPIFLATVKGKGVSGKNNLGLWGFDSDGFQRQLLRNGDQLGDVTVKKFTMLSPGVGVLNASRSFNATGGVTALVSLSDKTGAILYIGIP